MGDVLEVARHIQQGVAPIVGCTCTDDLPILPMDELVMRYYLRFSVTDRPGVLETMAGVFARHNISVKSIVQRGRSGAERVDQVVVTHRCRERDIREALEEALALVNLAGYGKRSVNSLSGGQQQRVAIARAIATHPPIIMADEPTGALDSKTGRHVLQILHELNAEGSTIILITHDNNIAAEAKRQVRLADGRITSDQVLKEVERA